MPFEHSIRVGWGHCDPAQIAYSGHLPTFALEAIDAWWEHQFGANWFEMAVDQNFGTPFVHMDLDFAHPVTPRHPLICSVRPVKLGNTSIEFRVEGRQGGNLCFTGNFVSVFMRSGEFEKAPPPEHVRIAVEAMLAEKE